MTLNEVLTGVVPYSDVSETDAQLHTVIETKYTPSRLLLAIVGEAGRVLWARGGRGGGR